MPISIIEFIAFTGALCSIISISFNIYQWWSRRSLEHMFYSHLFALYNHMSRVDELNQAAKREFNKSKKPNQNMQAMIRNIDTKPQRAYVTAEDPAPKEACQKEEKSEKKELSRP